MKPRLMFFLSALLFAVATTGQIHVSGPVSGNWSDTVYVDGDLIVEEGESLQIAAGTKVIFTTPAIFHVGGSLQSNGTVEEPIYFTVSDTTGFADSSSLAGAWQGLVYSHMVPTTDSSVFQHTWFEYTKDKRDNGETSLGGAFTVNGFSKLRFSYCTFSKAHSWSGGGAAAMTGGADIVFKNCVFTNCRVYDSLMGYGGALYAFQSSPVVEHCLFDSNLGVWLGGGLCFYYSNPLIRFNEFRGNNAYIGGGISLVHCRPQRVISNNVLHHNGPAIFGGGIACNNASDPVFANNTIVENFAIYGGGFYCNDSAAPTVYNTIISNNIGFAPSGAQVYIWDVYSHPNFYYCNIQDGLEGFYGSGAQGGYHGIYENNLDTTNNFQAGGAFPWVLSDSSLLRDAGTPDTTGLQITTTDFAQNPRMVRNRVDIGAFEWQSGAGMRKPNSHKIASVSPNPTSGHVVITLPDGEDGMHQINLYDPAGRWVGMVNIEISGLRGEANLTPFCSRNTGWLLLVIKGNNHQYKARVTLTH